MNTDEYFNGTLITRTGFSQTYFRSQICYFWLHRVCRYMFNDATE